MRIILLLWAVPLSLFWGWYALSFYDISFGTIFLSRELHDLVFKIYGNLIGVPAGEVPGLAAWACVTDTGILAAIAAFRWRASWYPQTRVWLAERFAGIAGGERARQDMDSASASLKIAHDEERRESKALPDGPALPAE